jgi:hypothetical protein
MTTADNLAADAEFAEWLDLSARGAASLPRNGGSLRRLGEEIELVAPCSSIARGPEGGRYDVTQRPSSFHTASA